MDQSLQSPQSDQTPRLNKYLALQLGLSRREADEMIARGSVLVDGKPAELGQRVVEGTAITVDGKPVAATTVTYRYVALNKPAGYVSSRRQQGDSPTIYSLLPADLHALKPVGRLDRDSSGLLLLTNDGDFAHAMTHPSFYKVKRYEVELDRSLAPLHQQMISDHGIELPDGPSKFTVSRMDPHAKRYEVTMHEGRNRQIRRTFEALGYTVTELHRIDFGAYGLGDLPSGHWQHVKKA